MLSECTQVSGIGPVKAIDWGITRFQVHELLLRLRRDPRWDSDNNVYSLVADFIVPWTVGHGVGYALLLNHDNPQRINVMVSHAFSENAEEFLEAVLRATVSGEVLYICALANYQAEDGVGPSIADQLGDDIVKSPFFSVISALAHHGRVHGGCSWWLRHCILRLPIVLFLISALIPAALAIVSPKLFGTDTETLANNQDDFDFKYTVGVSVFICFSIIALLLHVVLRHCSPIYPGRLLIVPNRNSDIYERLWCVYELYHARQSGLHIEMAPTWARAGRTKATDAVCSAESDAQRIRLEIEASSGGFLAVDASVRQALNTTVRHTLGMASKYFVLLVIPNTGLLLTLDDPQLSSDTIQVLFVYLGWLLFLYGLARKSCGVFSSSIGWTTAVAGICLSFAIVQLRVSHRSQRCLLNDKTEWAVSFSFLKGLGQLTCEVYAAALVYLGACCRPTLLGYNSRWRIPIVCALFVLVFFLNQYYQHWLWPSVENYPRIAQYDDFTTAAGVTTPVYMIWTESVNWGIKVKDPIYKPRIAGILAWICFALILWWHVVGHWFVMKNLPECFGNEQFSG